VFLYHLKALDEEVSVELGGSIILDHTSRSVHLHVSSTIHHALLENIISEGVPNSLSKKMPN